MPLIKKILKHVDTELKKIISPNLKIYKLVSINSSNVGISSELQNVMNG